MSDGLEGMWSEKEERVVIINVYSPSNLNLKRLLCRALCQEKSSSTIEKWCVLSDFNCVRSEEERQG